MVEGASYDKLYQWTIIIGDYSATDPNPAKALDRLYCPPMDRERWQGFGAQSGFPSMNPVNPIIWDDISPTIEQIDAKFKIINAETCNVLVVFYFSGHGLMHPEDDTTCCIMPVLNA